MTDTTLDEMLMILSVLIGLMYLMIFLVWVLLSAG